MSHARCVATMLVMIILAGCSAGDRIAPTGPATALRPASAGIAGSVSGSAHWQVFPATGLGLRRLTFHANRYPDGTVSGEWQIVVGATILHGDIDCLTILPDGRTARVAGIVEHSKFTTFQVGTAFGLLVVDRGQGANDPVDETTDLLSFRNAPPEVGREFCENGTAPPGTTLDEIDHGNFQVRAGSS